MGKGKKYSKAKVVWGRELAEYVGASVADIDFGEDEYWDEEEDWYEEEDQYEEEDTEDLEFERSERRTRLNDACPPGKGHDEVVPGSLPEELSATLEEADKLRKEIEDARDVSTLTALDGRIDAVVKHVDTVGEAAGKRATRWKHASEGVGKIKVPDLAEVEEAKAVNDALKRAHEALNIQPPTDTSLNTAEEALEEAKEHLKEALEQIGLREEERKRIQSEYEKLEEVEPFIKAHIDALKRDRGAFDEEMKKPLSLEANGLANEALKTLTETIARIKIESAELGDKAGVETLCSEAGASLDNYDALQDGLGDHKAVVAFLKSYPAKDLGNLIQTFGGVPGGAKKLGELATAYGSPAELKKAMDGLGGADNMVALVGARGGDAGKTKELLDGLGGPFVGALMGSTKDPAKAVGLYDHLGGDVLMFQGLAKDSGLDKNPKAFAAIFLTGCGGKPETFETFCKDYATESDRKALGAVLDEGGLGAAPEALGQLVAKGCDGKADGLIKFVDVFKEDGPRNGLKRALTDGGLAGIAAEPPSNGAIDMACLAQMLHSSGGPVPEGKDEGEYRAKKLGALLEYMDTDACGRFKDVLRKGGLGEAPDALGHVIGLGCNGDAGQLDKFSTSFAAPEAQAGLKRMFDDGGFKGKTPPPLAKGDIDPRCLGELLKNGMGPPPKGFGGDADQRRTDGLATLVKGLDKSACEDFKKLLTEGGVGKAPSALGHLVGHGCEGKPADLKNVIGAFDSKEKREGLERLLTTGGLEGKKKGEVKSGDIDPACLGYMLKHSAGISTPPKGADDRGKALAALCEGMTGPSCGELKTTLKGTGLGFDPQVFGHFVGTGCATGTPAKHSDPTKLSEFAQKLAADGPAQGKLKDMLQKGGFGTKDKDGNPVDIKPECLANMFNPGCEGKPEELIKLVNALDTTALTNLNGVMVTGEFGKHPKALGKTYQKGCLDNPIGARTGDKNPEVFKAMMSGFAPPAGPAKFKDLMDHGGFGVTGQEDRLGSVVRYAFTPKPPAAEKQQADKLVQLHTAFNGNWSNLTDMVGAFESAPDWVLGTDGGEEKKRLGSAFRNVVQAPGHGGDATQLKTKFFDKLNNRANAGAGHIPHGVVRLTKDELLQHAASFEHEPVANGHRVAVNGGIDLRADHVLERHTRKNNAFILNGGNDPTTLYPNGTDQNRIVNLVNGALATLNNPAPNRGARPHHQRPPVQKRNPPLDRFDLNHPDPWTPFNNVGDGDGTSKIGFHRDGANFPKAMITQFYPKTGTNLIKVANVDMAAMRDATR
ncbi:MAG: hypothetical protein AB3N23_01070 [Paracoccaceae bacterium]